MHGYTQVVTAATAYPITVAEAKEHLRITGSDDDDALADYLASVRDWLGRLVAGGAVVNSTTYDWFLPYLVGTRLYPPHVPLQSVTSFSYYDANNDAQTLTEGTQFTVHAPTDQPGWLHLESGYSWPTTRVDREDAVTIRYVAGYSTVPARLKQAARLALGGFWEFRESMVSGTTINELPAGVRQLMDSMDYGFYG